MREFVQIVASLGRRTCLPLAIAGTLAACSPTIEQHGHVLTPEQVAEIRPGNVTRAEVSQILGTPTVRAPLDDAVWYYISETRERFAFFDPETVDRRILIMRFDPAGVLDQIGTVDATDGQEVTLVSRETPTAGHKLTLLEQLLGNFGRFNAADE